MSSTTREGSLRSQPQPSEKYGDIFTLLIWFIYYSIPF